MTKRRCSTRFRVRFESLPLDVENLVKLCVVEICRSTNERYEVGLNPRSKAKPKKTPFCGDSAVLIGMNERVVLVSDIVWMHEWVIEKDLVGIESMCSYRPMDRLWLIVPGIKSCDATALSL